MNTTIKLPSELVYNDTRDAEKLLPLSVLISALAYMIPTESLVIAQDEQGRWYAQGSDNAERLYAGDDCDNPPKIAHRCFTSGKNCKGWIMPGDDCSEIPLNYFRAWAKNRYDCTPCYEEQADREPSYD